MTSKEAADTLNKRLICFRNKDCNIHCVDCGYYVSDEQMMEAWGYAIGYLNNDEPRQRIADSFVKVSTAIIELITEILKNQKKREVEYEKIKDDRVSTCNDDDDGNSGTGADD